MTNDDYDDDNGIDIINVTCQGDVLYLWIPGLADPSVPYPLSKTGAYCALWRQQQTRTYRHVLSEHEGDISDISAWWI